MRVNLDRFVKAYCPDFTPVRQLLRELGATLVDVKEQSDYIYHLADTGEKKMMRRLKLRIENNERLLLHYYDRKGKDTGATHFQFWKVGDPQIKTILDTTLGVKATVRKQREVWRKGSVIFNLDTVEGIGQIFEIEVFPKEGCSPDFGVAEYRHRFEQFLGGHLTGSNEDLVNSPP